MSRNGWTALCALGLGVTLVALSGCGGSGTPQSSKEGARPARPSPPVSRQAPQCRAGSEQRLGNLRMSYAAVVPRHARVFRVPGRHLFAAFGAHNANGAVTVLGVRGRLVNRGCAATWYRVELPIRPNGVTGWVHASAVQVGVVHTRIVVQLSERRLTLFRDGRPVLHAIAAVGAPSTPTPTGRFYVNQRLIPPDPYGPWGPGAIGISAYSNVLKDWVQGGPIAIHGTDEPWSIGKAASHGCVRLDNAVLRKVFAVAGAGTPVIIRT